MRSRIGRFLTGVVVTLVAGSCGGGGGSGGGGGTPTPQELFVLDAAGAIWRYAPAAPGTPLGSFAVTGLATGQRVVAIDLRPATQQICGVAVDANGTGTNALYVNIDVTTGVATSLAPAFTMPAGAADAGYGCDFRPDVDRFRVVSSADVNFRFNPNNGALSGQDTAIAPAGQQIEAIAYDRNTPGGTSSDTTLYAINAQTAQLQTVGGLNQMPFGSNSGILLDPLPLGVAIDATGTVAFEIFGVDQAFAIFDGDPSAAFATALYAINLTTGTATLVGALGAGPALPVRGMALR